MTVARPARPCVHHWVLPPADGREMLPARCRRCGATNAFISTDLWEHQNSKLNENRRRGVAKTQAQTATQMAEHGRRLVRSQALQPRQARGATHARIVRLAGSIDFAPINDEREALGALRGEGAA